jgi:hypothetical protein
MSILNESRGAHVTRLADARMDVIADTVIEMFRNLGPHARQSGDDSPLENVWEEFKEQVQHGESILWEFYEDTLLKFCEAEVERLAPFERDVLWFWTEGFIEWDEEDEDAPPIFGDQIAREIYDRIKARAADEPLRHELEDEADEANEADEAHGNQLVSDNRLTQAQLRLDW